MMWKWRVHRCRLVALHPENNLRDGLRGRGRGRPRRREEYYADDLATMMRRMMARLDVVEATQRRGTAQASDRTDTHPHRWP